MSSLFCVSARFSTLQGGKHVGGSGVAWFSAELGCWEGRHVAWRWLSTDACCTVYHLQCKSFVLVTGRYAAVQWSLRCTHVACDVVPAVAPSTSAPTPGANTATTSRSQQMACSSDDSTHALDSNGRTFHLQQHTHAHTYSHVHSLRGTRR
jgi:hypothetical protein